MERKESRFCIWRSNVMEFHGVGSMPQLVYREQVNQVEQPGDL